MFEESSSQCYQAFKESTTWNNAKRHCESVSASLAVVNSPEITESFKLLPVKQWASKALWIDLRRASWNWVSTGDTSQQEVTDPYWADGEPDGVNADCVKVQKSSIDSNYNWYNEKCHTKLRTACVIGELNIC